MKRLFIVLGVLVMFLGIVPVNAEELTPLANQYETLYYSDQEAFHKNSADEDKFYGYIKFVSQVRANINTGNCTTSSKSATPYPQNNSKLSATGVTDGYVGVNDNYYYVRWTYTAKTSSGALLRNGPHNHKY